MLLFVRHEQKDDFGTSPYLFLGPATYVSHTGDRPIAITWKLRTPMPTDFFNLTSRCGSVVRGKLQRASVTQALGAGS